MDREKLLNDLDMYAYHCKGEVFKKVLQEAADTIRELMQKENMLEEVLKQAVSRTRLLKVLEFNKQQAGNGANVVVNINSLIEYVQGMPAVNAEPVMIWPRSKNDRGGYVCMPLTSNLPYGRPGWKITKCPQCGRKCWETPMHKIAEESGAIALCTECALRKGSSIDV